MNKGLIVGGMPDTMEYYSLFHMALKLGGWFELLLTILMVVVEMICMQLSLQRLALYLNRNK